MCKNFVVCFFIAYEGKETQILYALMGSLAAGLSERVNEDSNHSADCRK